ncbi:HAMP domain-containing sensor histidine kinase [Psychrobacter sp.]|uniref:sensor histidine kinase n=1 Tax=Psychrobacter sp. TaxID=56811 RepID=UPI0025EBC663|nr:HAMP domain-containing sensor histidine kinase [Psychrobacter sp.]
MSNHSIGLLIQKSRNTLQWRLIGAVIFVALIFTVLVATYSAWQSYHQAQKLQDAKLTSLVNLAKSHDLTLSNKNKTITLNYGEDQLNSSNTNLDEDDLELWQSDPVDNPIIIYWLTDKHLKTYFSADELDHLRKLPDGLYDVEGTNSNYELIKWRVYLSTGPITKSSKLSSSAKKHLSNKRIIIAEKADIRDILAWNSATHILIPMLTLIPLLAVVLLLVINRLFLPLREITKTLSDSTNYAHTFLLSDNSLSLLKDEEYINQLPTEIQTFLRVIQSQIKHLLQSMKMNKRFVANASHQLRTPMTSVLLLAEQLKNINPNQIDYQLKIDTLLASIKRTSHLMNQLLLLLKIEQGVQTDDNLYQFSPSRVIEDVLIDCYPLADSKQISLGVGTLKDIPIPVSELEFKLIVQNLVENSIKYTPNKGQIVINLDIKDQRVIFQIKDSGPGIPEHEISKITEPFYRSTAHYQKDYHLHSEGFGLGLSIVQNIINNRGGKLILTNCYDKNEPKSIIGLVATVQWGP